MKKRKRLAAVLLSLSLLFTMGCSGERPEKSIADITKKSDETTAAETDGRIPDDASLASLRQAMMETPQLFAVSYFGYHDTVDSDLPVDPYEVLREYTPQLCADLPFLLEIPRERIIGEYGELYCIVPLDEDATVVVTKGTWDGDSEQYLYEQFLYYGNSGEPILLFCNNAGFEPDTQVYFSGPSGETVWYPQIDDNQCAMPLRNDNWDDLFFDFSPYRELLLAEYHSMNGEWVKPTTQMLIGTTWVWDRFLKDGREVSYRLTFAEDTLSVRWNDGIDEEDHEYPDAAWKLTEEDGFCVLSIDFREFAGVLRYDLMYHEEFELLYVGMDVVQEELPIGWEPLYRYLGAPEPPEPAEMLGDWELEWTEVEDFRENVAPGTENISIFLNDDNGFRITLTDAVFPRKSFTNKDLGVYEGELYSGCGNDQWMCYIGYMGAENIVYSLTLTQDDILLMEMYWEIDGGVPMVAHKGYRRMGW